LLIDIHSHHVSTGLKTSPPLCRKPSLVLREQERAGIDLGVMSDPFILKQADDAKLSRLKAIRMSHEYYSKFCRSNSDRFRFFAFGCPSSEPEYLQELLRALEDEYCSGIVINSNVDGDYPDSSGFRKIYEAACDKRVPVFIHPNFKSIGYDQLLQYHLLSILGRPTDVSLAAFRLILSGIFEEFPKLRVICAYGGGALTMLKLRLDNQCETPRHKLEKKFADILTKLPSKYFGSFYADTTTMSPEAIVNTLNVLGKDHVLMGTDFPPGSILPKNYVREISKLPVASKVRQGIAGGNAMKLLRL
jgi:predicted TIM-barrel fold metal-dependent hydrolase